MTDTATSPGHHGPGKPILDTATNPAGAMLFMALLIGFIGFAAYSVVTDTNAAGTHLAAGAFVFLGIALLIALGFEFVNGFHDTANAVATVIYTHSMPPLVAVVWSGCFNFLGVLFSSGAVAYGIITLLPVELILQVGSSGGYAMIFALLFAAIIWNLGTWALGIPNSSSHALIGSIMGVGLANQFMAPAGQAASGVDWAQAGKIIQALIFSPLVGFALAALLLLLMRAIIRVPALYREPAGNQPPPVLIRLLLILTCTSVSFAHGSNDGQKGMGLIMLILIGVAPTAYALNRTMPDKDIPAFVVTLNKAEAVFATHATGQARPDMAGARTVIGEALKTKKFDKPEVYAALGTVSADIEKQLVSYKSLALVPAAQTSNLRNEMYMVGDSVRQLNKSIVIQGQPCPSGVIKAGDPLTWIAILDPSQWQKIFGPKPADPCKGHPIYPKAEASSLTALQKALEVSTRFIPTWVKIAVAFALGLGTMVGWKRIVVTVGERIGKTHMTYGQGASAEIVAAVTITGADMFGLPVSTTHILSSGIAGTMAANGSGLQWSTIRNIASAWVLTLPAAITLAGGLYILLRSVLH